MPAFIVWFEQLSRSSGSFAGGKGANLGEMTSAGLPVPGGFVVTTAAFLAALDTSGARAELQALFKSVDADSPPALAAASGWMWPSSTISAVAGTCRGTPKAAVTSVRAPRSRPANWYSLNESGTGVTAPSSVAGSAPSATATGYGLPGFAAQWSAKSSAPPRWASQRTMTWLRAITCWR